MIAAVIAGHCFRLKLIVIVSSESIEWLEPRRTIFWFGLCECGIGNCCQLIILQVTGNELRMVSTKSKLQRVMRDGERE